ncbi:MAG: hypothetical protein UU09_C0021G0002 [Microgenomates group bacterium GW2011_GWA2_40_6]|nr:MAG: hypothetical protein UU09_C0021G0002 [Microgenomates group bacterium GW2011_GWA2_40_6]
MKKKKKKQYIPPEAGLLGEEAAYAISDCQPGSGPTVSCDNGCVVDCGVAQDPFP